MRVLSQDDAASISAGYRLPVLAVLVLVFLLAACDSPAKFRAPLSEPGSASYDERLIGAWGAISGEDSSGSSAILVVKSGEAGMLRAAFTMTILDPWGEVSATSIWYEWLVHPTEIDGATYFNGRVRAFNRFGGGMAGDAGGAILTDPTILEREPVYEIGVVELATDDLITLFFFSDNKIGGRGFGAHQMLCGDECTFRIHDISPEVLREMIRSQRRDDLFRTSMTFKRLSGSDPIQIGE